MVSEYVLFALSPYFYKLFVDAIPSLSLDVLFRILVIYMATRVTAMILDLIVGIAGDYLTFKAATNARIKIFKKVQDLDFAFHSERSTGSLISTFKRGDAAYFSFFHDIHYRLFSAFVSFFVMFYFFAKLNLLIVGLVSLSLVIALIATRFLIANNVSKRRVFNDEEDDVSAIITDNLINFETVKLFAKESWEESRLRSKFVSWMKALWGYGNSFRLIDAVMGTIINLSIFFVLYLTISQAVSAKLNVGDFVLVTAFLANFYPKLWDLVWSFRDIAKNFADIEKYFDLLDYDIKVKDPVRPVKVAHVYGEINFRDVHFTYGGRTKNAINGINLKIEQGQSVALVGRSGSGKTTMTKLLMRFYDIDSGEITIDGININEFAKSTLRGFVGVVPQEPILFNNTIAYNIGYGKDKPKVSEIKAAAKLANIDKFIEGLKDKYETQVGERGVKLSGGQKQRLAIARMILSDPDIIIFDEATSHLDSESEKLIQDAFWKARRGKTTIIIAHRLSTIMRADKIVVMNQGKIAEMGTHEDLLNNKVGIYKHLWDLQVDKN